MACGDEAATAELCKPCGETGMVTCEGGGRESIQVFVDGGAAISFLVLAPSRFVVLNLWVRIPLGVERSFPRGHISGIHHIRYLH